VASLMGMRRGARCIVHHRSASRTQPPGLPYTSAPAIVTIAVEDIEHPPLSGGVHGEDLERHERRAAQAGLFLFVTSTPPAVPTPPSAIDAYCCRGDHPQALPRDISSVQLFTKKRSALMESGT
jgi:hypothetical protein